VPFQAPAEVQSRDVEPDMTKPKLHWKFTRSPKWYISCNSKYYFSDPNTLLGDLNAHTAELPARFLTLGFKV
jgi:hypothetical protein